MRMTWGGGCLETENHEKMRRRNWRQCEKDEEKGETREREGEKKKEKSGRQREGLSLGLQTTVLFQSGSRVPRAGRGSVFLFGGA